MAKKNQLSKLLEKKKKKSGNKPTPKEGVVFPDYFEEKDYLVKTKEGNVIDLRKELSQEDFDLIYSASDHEKIAIAHKRLADAVQSKELKKYHNAAYRKHHKKSGVGFELGKVGDEVAKFESADKKTTAFVHEYSDKFIVGIRPAGHATLFLTPLHKTKESAESHAKKKVGHEKAANVSGGNAFIIKKSDQGYVKEIRKDGKLQKEVTVGGKKYRFNGVYKTFNSVKDNLLLHASDWEKEFDSGIKASDSEKKTSSAIESQKTEGRYVILEKLPGRLEISLTPEGIEKAKEDGIGDSSNFDEFFEDIHVNSKWEYLSNIGNAGLGMTDAPGFIYGFDVDDEGNLQETSDSELYYFNNYALRDAFEGLVDGAKTSFDAADNNFAKGGKIKASRKKTRTGLPDSLRPFTGKYVVVEDMGGNSEISSFTHEGDVRVPEFFDTEKKAKESINELISDVKDAVKRGDMEDEYDADDYYIAHADLDADGHLEVYFMSGGKKDIVYQGPVVGDADGNFARGGKVSDDRIDEILRHYMIAALWSSGDEKHESFDSDFDIEDISDETKAGMRGDVDKFVQDNLADLDASGLKDEQIGHDFWLTRHHHGAGFWDRGLDKELGDRLTTGAQKFKEGNLEVGDDDMVYYNGHGEREDKFAKGGIPKELDFSSSNLILVGKGLDLNGNRVVKVQFPNDRAFSIQTNGALPKTHDILRGVTKIGEVSSGDMRKIEEEVNDYVRNYGSVKQKKKLKIYRTEKKASGSQVMLKAKFYLPLGRPGFEGYYNPEENFSSGYVPHFSKKELMKFLRSSAMKGEKYKFHTDGSLDIMGETITPQSRNTVDGELSLYECGLIWAWQIEPIHSFVSGGTTERTDIFTIDLIEIEGDEERSLSWLPFTGQTYYDEQSAIDNARKLIVELPEGSYKVFVNYGEYQVPSGDIFGEVTHQELISADGNYSQGGALDFTMKWTKVEYVNSSQRNPQENIIAGITDDGEIYLVNIYNRKEQKSDYFSITHASIQPYTYREALAYSKQHWTDFFEQEPEQLADMNERMGTKFRSPSAAAKYVLDVDGELHGFDQYPRGWMIKYKGKDWIFQASSFGASVEGLRRLTHAYLPLDLIEKMIKWSDEYHLRYLPGDEQVPVISQDRDSILRDAIGRIRNKKQDGGTSGDPGMPGTPQMAMGGKVTDIKNDQLRKAVDFIESKKEGYSFYKYIGAWRYLRKNESVLLITDTRALFVLLSYFPEDDDLSFAIFTDEWTSELDRPSNMGLRSGYATDDEGMQELLKDMNEDVEELYKRLEENSSWDQEFGGGGNAWAGPAIEGAGGVQQPVYEKGGNVDNYKKTITLGEIDYYGTGRKVNEVTVEIEIRNKPEGRAWDTLEEVRNVPELSMSAKVWNSKKNDIVAGGQMLDELPKYFRGNVYLKRLVQIWKEYHLHDMRAGTKAQIEALRKANVARDYDTTVEYLKSIDLYEDRGYRYGSEWLYQPLPQEIIEEVKRLADMLEAQSSDKKECGGTSMSGTTLETAEPATRSLPYNDGGPVLADDVDQSMVYAGGGSTRVANRDAKDYTENRYDFKGNLLEGKNLENGDYVVLSKGYYPIWYWSASENKWYGNTDKYSVTTAKHISQSRPTHEPQMLNHADLVKKMGEGNARYELGGDLAPLAIKQQFPMSTDNTTIAHSGAKNIGL